MEPDEPLRHRVLRWLTVVTPSVGLAAAFLAWLVVVPAGMTGKAAGQFAFIATLPLFILASLFCFAGIGLLAISAKVLGLRGRTGWYVIASNILLFVGILPILAAFAIAVFFVEDVGSP